MGLGLLEQGNWYQKGDFGNKGIWVIPENLVIGQKNIRSFFVHWRCETNLR